MRGPALGRALLDDSPLHRRNPTVKLAVLLVVTTGVVAVFAPWTPAALYAVTVPAVLRGGRVPWRLLASAQLFFAPFALSILMVNAVTRPGEPVPLGRSRACTSTRTSVPAARTPSSPGTACSSSSPNAGPRCASPRGLGRLPETLRAPRAHPVR